MSEQTGAAPVVDNPATSADVDDPQAGSDLSVEQLREQIAHLQDRLEKSNRDRSHRNNQNKTFKQELEQREAAIAKLSQELDQFKQRDMTEIEKYQSQVERLSGELKSAQTEAKQARRDGLALKAGAWDSETMAAAIDLEIKKDPDLDDDQAIELLREKKPFLFKPSQSAESSGGASSPDSAGGEQGSAGTDQQTRAPAISTTSPTSASASDKRARIAELQQELSGLMSSVGPNALQRRWQVLSEIRRLSK